MSLNRLLWWTALFLISGIGGYMIGKSFGVYGLPLCLVWGWLSGMIFPQIFPQPD